MKEIPLESRYSDIHSKLIPHPSKEKAYLIVTNSNFYRLIGEGPTEYRAVDLEGGPMLTAGYSIGDIKIDKISIEEDETGSKEIVIYEV